MRPLTRLTTCLVLTVASAIAAFAQEAAPSASPEDAIDRTADVVVETFIDIAAAPDQVWGVLTDVADWPEWNPAIERAQIEGPLDAGSVIAWKPDETGGGWAIRSEITQVGTAQTLDWRGLGDGTLGIHSWRLLPIEGGTRVYNTESFDGGMAAQSPEMLQAAGEAFLLGWNEALKVEAERLARR